METMFDKIIKAIHDAGGCDEAIAEAERIVKKIVEGLKQTGTLLTEYQAIGTVEECREAVEKQKPKKPNVRENISNDSYMECPVCDSFIGYEYDCRDEHYQSNYCPCCGQELDWGMEDEDV